MTEQKTFVVMVRSRDREFLAVAQLFKTRAAAQAKADELSRLNKHLSYFVKNN